MTMVFYHCYITNIDQNDTNIDVILTNNGPKNTTMHPQPSPIIPDHINSAGAARRRAPSKNISAINNNNNNIEIDNAYLVIVNC
jgi:hypothetical protein